MFSYDYQYNLSLVLLMSNLILININVMDIKKTHVNLSFHMKKKKHEIIIRIKDNH